jgi:hypothetical protein
MNGALGDYLTNNGAVFEAFSDHTAIDQRVLVNLIAMAGTVSPIPDWKTNSLGRKRRHGHLSQSPSSVRSK